MCSLTPLQSLKIQGGLQLSRSQIIHCHALLEAFLLPGNTAPQDLYCPCTLFLLQESVAGGKEPNAKHLISAVNESILCRQILTQLDLNLAHMDFSLPVNQLELWLCNGCELVEEGMQQTVQAITIVFCCPSAIPFKQHFLSHMVHVKGEYVGWA